MSDAWSREEVEAAVADYLHMLTLDLAGQRYSKSEHRRALLPLLNKRSAAAVELKHQNISAILIELGCPYINGYKPRRNYQKLLHDVLVDRLRNSVQFDRAAMAAVERPAVTPAVNNFTGILVDAPRVSQVSQRNAPAYRTVGRKATVRDYLAREASNQALGKAGEEFAMKYERWRLRRNGKDDLARRVEHVSRTKGDGLGFDVLSYELNGKERFIEVKTTSFGRDTPFFVTRNEYEVSRAENERFHLYRLFEFRQDPKLFTLRGPIDSHCFLDPVSFKASFS